MQPARLPVVLSSYLSSRDHYRETMFSPNEVFCGPDAADAQQDGRWRSLRTPAGQYDLAGVAARLPAAQQPDLVVVKTDATNRNYPRNLQALRCPKVLVLGDTQHLTEPLRRLLDYAQAERFDFILSDHNRQHLHVFRKAGFKNVHWLPCLTWRPYWREVPATVSARHMVFVGQVGRFHPYRSWLFGELRRRGLPLTVQRLAQHQAADAYAAAAIALNCSLNGDLNLRILEILGAGGLLFTDRLSAASGLHRLLREDEDYIAYGSPDELADKARRYLAEPEAALDIRRRGRARVAADLGAEAMIEAFHDLVFNGRERAEFRLDDEPRHHVAAALPRAAVLGRAATYELVQDLHRSASSVVAFLPDDAAGRGVAEDLSDLVRLRPAGHAALADGADGWAAFASAEEVAPHHVLLLSDLQDTAGWEPCLQSFRGQTVAAIGDGWSVARLSELTAVLSRWGFIGRVAGQTSFPLLDPVRSVRASSACGDRAAAQGKLAALAAAAPQHISLTQLAALAGDVGDAALALELLRRAVRLDRDHIEALRRLAGAAGAEPWEALLALDHLRGVAGLTPAEEDRRGRLAAELSDEAVTRRLLAAASAESGHAAPPRRILAVTNLFPPQELGGYGRMQWEYVRVLAERGHDVRVVTANADYLDRPCADAEKVLEPLTVRELQLYGEWRDGKTSVIGDRDEITRRLRHNHQTILRHVEDFRPDAILLGNIDFVGFEFIKPCLERGIAVVHSIANGAPGYPKDQAPNHPLFTYAPCSRWLGESLKNRGFAIGDYKVVYPGARVPYFSRAVLPERGKLRIAYGSLVMPYKGAHVLVEALTGLHRNGIDFSCALAGDTFDATFLAKLKAHVEQAGFAGKMTFPGFLDRAGLARLFARSNVLVFPSQFDEPFGITQVEALAAGLVVVTSATGGSGEIVRDGIDGLHFAKTDPGDLARKLASLPADGERWRQLALAGRERAQEFTVARSVEVIENAIEPLLSASN